MPSPTLSAAERDHLADALDVVRTRVLAGPNRWRREPVVTGDVLPGSLAANPALLAEAREALRPALGDLPHAPQDAGDDAGAEWAHAVATLAVALQRRAGAEVEAWARLAPGDEPESWAFAIGYEEDGAALASVRAAARLLRRAVAGDRLDVDGMVDDLRARLDRERLAPSVRLVVAEARRRDIPVRRAPGESAVQLGLGCRQRRLDGLRTDRTSALATERAADPERARDLLARLGLPVPRGVVAIDADDAAALAEEAGFPACVRRRGAGEAGERCDDPAPARAAYERARARGGDVVVERLPQGAPHRVLVVDGRVVAVAERGRDAAGRERVADRTDAIDAANAAVCAFAADTIGLDVAGLDVVTPDIGVPFQANGGAIVAVHADPGLRLHAAPDDGSARDVAGAIVDALFSAGSPSRIPVVAVTGTNGKTTTTRLVAHLLRQAGHRVGFTTTDGVYHEEHLVFAGDMTGPMAADMVLSNPRVDAAVLETARGGILRAGLGYDACDVGVVLNVTPDHLGLRGIHTVEQLAEVKAVIVDAVRPDGHAVLNADDPLVLRMAARTSARVVLFSLQAIDAQPAVAAHVRAGGRAITVEPTADGEALVLHAGGAAEAEGARLLLALVGEIPLTERGAARFQVQNAAAASAAAWACGVAPEAIRAGLARFVPSASTTPGRMNVLRVREATVIVDYAHNPAAIRALIEYAQRVEAGRRIAVLSTPGDRRDDDIRVVGGLGAGLDRVVFMESPHYRRGRPAGENTARLLEGLVAAGGDAARATCVTGQEAAVDEVLRLLEPRDLVLFVADDAALVIGRLEARTRDAG